MYLIVDTIPLSGSILQTNGVSVSVLSMHCPAVQKPIPRCASLKHPFSVLAEIFTHENIVVVVVVVVVGTKLKAQNNRE